MPSHVTLVVIISTKESTNSLTQGMAKYQPIENNFQNIHWKYFYPFQKSYTDFSVGNIILFSGKFINENSELYITVTHVTVIAAGDPQQEFKVEEIPLSIPHCMFAVTVKREPKNVRETTYFGTECYQYNSITNSRNVLMKMNIIFPTHAPRFNYFHTGIKVGRTLLVSSFFKCIKNEIIYIDVTDIDYINTFNTNYNKQEGSSTNSNISSDIDLIAEEIESTASRTPKRQRNPTPKSPTQDEDLSFITKEDPTSSTKHPQNRKGKETFKPNIEDIEDNIEKEGNLEEEKDPSDEEELDNRRQRKKRNTRR